MIHKRIKLSHVLHSLLIVSLGYIVTSCEQNPGNNAGPESGMPLKIGAQIKGVNSTRAYRASGPVEEGSFHMTYINTDHQICTANVEFNGGIGTVTTTEGENLEWTAIGFNRDSETISTFYLDNVKRDDNDIDHQQIIELGNDNPFKASLFDDNEGSNDLLWGTRQISRNSPIVNFELHHCMSRICLEITVENNSEGLVKDPDVKNATAWISSLLHDPEKYDKLKGELIFPEYPVYKDLKLVNPEDPTTSWEITEENNAGQDITIYKSKVYVLPPQELLTDEHRPRLYVSVPGKNGESPTVYSGLIPRVMEMKQDDGTIIPMNLSLLREYYLTFHVKLSLEPLEIIFMPVTVVEWIEKGTFIIGAYQSGLYNEEDMKKMIEAYNNMDEEALERLGYKDRDSGNWVFNLFKDLEIDFETLNNQLHLNDLGPISFNMHGWSIYIKKEGRFYELKKSDQIFALLTEGELPQQD